MGIADRLKKLFSTARPLEPGFHSFRGELPDGFRYRLHLRIEPGGAGVMVINAAKVLHLNQSAAEYVKLLMDGLPDEAVARAISSRYQVKKDRALADYLAFKEKLMAVIESDEVCPIGVLEFGRVEPFSMPVTAPYRMDLALTHRCHLNCGHCYAGGPRETKELETADWKRVIDRLFEIGIPHVCFTGGEATLREDLPDLIAHAEDLGLVTGLLTNGCALADPGCVKQLVEAGLDHVQITIESHDPAVHDAMVGGTGFEKTAAGIKNALAAGLYTITNTTLTKKNAAGIKDTVSFLHELGVERFAMNGMIHAGRGQAHPDALSPDELEEVLDQALDIAAELEMKLIWYTPTRYCEFNPVERGLGMKRCTAGQYNMCVEPDGSVLPCQSYFESAGRILDDDWGKIWNHPLLAGLRRREWVSEECAGCEELAICGGGCPLEQKDQAALCPDSLSNFA